MMVELKENLKYPVGCIYNNEIWFADLELNGIFSINIKSLSVKFHDIFPHMKKFVYAPYLYVCHDYEEKLYFLPHNSNRISIYDLKTKNIESICMPMLDEVNYFITRGYVFTDNQIYIFPFNMEQGIWILNLQTIQIKKEHKISKILNNIDKIELFINISDSKIAVLAENNRLVEINIKTEEKVFEKFFEETLNINRIIPDGDNYWILQSDSTDIIEWKRKEDNYIVYKLVEEEWSGIGTIPYNNIIFGKEQIIVLNFHLKYIMRIDKERRIIEKAIDYPKGYRIVENQLVGWGLFGEYTIIGNKIWIPPIRGNMLLIYDMETNKIEGKELYVTANEYPLCYEDYIAEDILFERKGFRSPETMANVLKNVKIKEKENVNLNIGGKIYHELSDK